MFAILSMSCHVLRECLNGYAYGKQGEGTKLCALCSGDEGGTLQATVPFKSLVTIQAAPEVGDPHLHCVRQQSLECLVALYCVEPTTCAAR